MFVSPTLTRSAAPSVDPASTVAPAPSEFARHWRLDPGITFLNHGSFGACPGPVLDGQRRYRDHVEREPISFFVVDLPRMMDDVRRALAQFCACRWQDLCLLPNVTWAVATVLSNLKLGPEDEVLVNDHEYPACVNSVELACQRAGARMVTARVPFPLSSPDDVFDAIMAKVGPRTRLVLLSHITSPTGLIFPVERIVAELNRRGVDSLVDGAHAPGFLDLNVESLRATYYAANCHKWLCCPKGTAFLHVRPDKQDDFRPLALSVNAKLIKPDRARFLVEFDYVGGDDYTPYFCIPDAIAFMDGLVPGGWPEIRRRNWALLRRAREHLLRALATPAPAPDSMIGCMATIPLPDRPATVPNRPAHFREALQEALLERHNIQVPIWLLPHNGRRAVRISAQLYNSFEQYERLADALRVELDRERAQA